jgi:hypothetical protein
MADWSLTRLQLKLTKIGARVVRHARAITFQMAEVAVTGPMSRAILAAIRRRRAPPARACPRSTPKLNASGSTGLLTVPKNTDAEPEHGGFAVRSALFQRLAHPTMSVRTKKACHAGTIGRSLRQTARHLENAGYHGPFNKI